MYVTSVDKIPKREHWAIITSASYTTPADERSMTNPGHGYPASTTEYIEYAAYFDEQKFRKALEDESVSLYRPKPIGIYVGKVYGTESKVVITSSVISK